jgi:serine/threonine protein kinase HipA of HipAB toxin-antitoxin module
MQRESRQRRKSMRETAEAIILNEDLRKSRLGEIGKIATNETASQTAADLPAS